MGGHLLQLVLLAIPMAVYAQQPLFAQCGRTGWTGDPWSGWRGEMTCVDGAYCRHISDGYSQCIPAPTTPGSLTTLATPTRTSASTVVPLSSTSAISTTTRVGSDSTTCPDLPANPDLPTNSKLPDPFAPISGPRVTTKSEFACRQDEISQLLQRYELGTLPGRPSSLETSFVGNTLTITVSDSGKSISFTATISYPSTGAEPYPALIGVGGISIPAPDGVAIITFNNDDMAAQVNSGSRGQGKFYDLYGSGHSAGAMTAWAWGISRIIDALEITSNARIDTERIGVTGCSRNGKGAMVAGALEPRIVLTIPQESGSGGSACWRLSDYQGSQGQNVQTASEIVGENVWFSANFDPYVNQVSRLPFDHHMLAGLVAPRALFVIENTSMEWLGNLACYGCMKVGQSVWQALGVGDSMGFSQVGNHDHCAFPSSQQGDLNAFVGKFLLDQETNTNIMKTDGTFAFNQAQWVDWTVPSLQ